mgnify:CR=1 FL=1
MCSSDLDITSSLGSSARVSYGNIGAGASIRIENIKAYGRGYRFGLSASAQATYMDEIRILSDSLPEGTPVKVQVVSEVFYGVEESSSGAGLITQQANDTSMLSSSFKIDSASGVRFDDTFCAGAPGYCGDFIMNGYFRHLRIDSFSTYVGESLWLYGSISVGANLAGSIAQPSGFTLAEGSAQQGIGAMNSQHVTLQVLTEGASYMAASGTQYQFATSVPESSALNFFGVGLGVISFARIFSARRRSAYASGRQLPASHRQVSSVTSA